MSEEAIADEFSSAASILQGQAAEGRPIILSRGYSTSLIPTNSSYLIRTKQKDLYAKCQNKSTRRVMMESICKSLKT